MRTRTIAVVALLLLAANAGYYAWRHGASPRAVPPGAVVDVRPAPGAPTAAAPGGVSSPAPAAAVPATAPASPAVPATAAPPGVSLGGTTPPEPVVAGSGLLLPVEGITQAQLVDTFDQARGDDRRHEALDIMAPAGTPVLAATDGRIEKLFTSAAGGLTIYQFDRRRERAYYYAHLQSYAPTVREGVEVRRGEIIGFVGSTGNANPAAPHLHFAIFELGPQKRWWEGTPVNPYPLLAR
ncbi:MAG: M23 family metallopeptidase [Pseudomonas sp.]|nr:M23 family metallopeptidase [Pseudomonas sp.]